MTHQHPKNGKPISEKPTTSPTVTGSRYDDKKSPGVLFSPGVAPFSINGSLPWLGAWSRRWFSLFFCVCVEAYIPPVQGGEAWHLFVIFFRMECHRPDLCGCFFVESLRHWRNYTLSFFVGKTMVSFFKSATNLLAKEKCNFEVESSCDIYWLTRIKTYEYGLRRCVSKKTFYFHRFFKPIQKLAFSSIQRFLGRCELSRISKRCFWGWWRWCRRCFPAGSGKTWF